jgi:hypothetical protein
MVSSTQTSEDDLFTIDPLIQHLLAQTINSPIKLHLVLLFHENPRMEGSARQIIQRIYRDIWSTRAALRELASDGILDVVERSGEPIYCYHPRPDDRVLIARLAERFNDPFAREEIYSMLHEFTSDALYYGDLARSVGEATACPCGCPVLYDSINASAS